MRRKRTLLRSYRIFESKREITRFWDRMSRSSVERSHIEGYYTTRLTFERVVGSAPLTEESLVLDAGCGWGRILRQFLVEDRSAGVVGIDLTLSLLEACRSDGYGGCLVNTNASRLPFRAASFDLVYAVRLLQYVDDVEVTLREFMRVTRAGGTVVIVQPNGGNPWRRLAYHTRLISCRLVERMFAGLGLEDIQVEYFGYSFPWFPMVFLERLAQAPILRRAGAFYLVRGSVRQKRSSQG